MSQPATKPAVAASVAHVVHAAPATKPAVAASVAHVVHAAPAPQPSLIARVEKAVEAAVHSVLDPVATAPVTAAPAVVGKAVVKPAAALQQGANPSPTATAAPAPAGKSWQFVKLFGIADTLRFADGSHFQFKQKRLNDGSGFARSSELVTTDATLASNLRTAARNTATGVVEVTSK